jgi:multiple sugar transport system substrate-binding protein
MAPVMTGTKGSSMIKRRNALVALAVTASVAVLTGCSGGGSGGNNGGGGGGGASKPAFSTKLSGSVTVWGFNSPDEVASSRYDYAKQQLKGVTVKNDSTQFDAQKFTTRVASGNVPDLVQMDQSYVTTYAAQGLIQPLDQCYTAYKQDPTKRYYPQITDYLKYKNAVFAVAQFYQPPGIILNERVMKKAGVSDSDIDTSNPTKLVAAIKKMYKSSNGKPTTLGFDPVATGQPYLWILGMGGQTSDASGKPTLDDPKNVKGMEVLKQIYDAQGGFSKVKSFSDAFDNFGKGNAYVTDKVGASVWPQWYVNVLTPYVKQVQIGGVPFKGADGQPYTASGGTAFVIPVGAKNKNAACAFALDATNTEAWMAAGAARAQTIKKTPGAINTGLFTGEPEADQKIRDTYVKPSGNKGFDDTIDMFYKILPAGKSYGASAAGQAIQQNLTNAIQSYLQGQKSAQAALKDAQSASLRAYNQALNG